MGMDMDEVVTYDPDDPDTYPSVCHSPEEVERRFGFKGGEKFTHAEIHDKLTKLNEEN